MAFEGNIEYTELFELFDVVADEIFVAVNDLDMASKCKQSSKKGHYLIDEKAQEIVVKHLYGYGAKIISEEANGIESGGNGKFEGLTFVVDPIDGTSNASRGLSDWAFSIYVKRNDEPWLGFVKHQVSRVKYLAVAGKGAYIDEVSENTKVVKPQVGSLGAVFVSFSRDLNDYHDLEKFLSELPYDISSLPNKHRILGSASIALAYVGVGKLDVHFHGGFALYGWDCLASLLFAREAGCVLQFEDNVLFENIVGNEKLLVNVY